MKHFFIGHVEYKSININILFKGLYVELLDLSECEPQSCGTIDTYF